MENKGVFFHFGIEIFIRLSLTNVFVPFFFQFEVIMIIVGFTLTVVNDFRRFLSRFSTNFHEILHTLFLIHVVITLKVSRRFDKYFRR